METGAFGEKVREGQITDRHKSILLANSMPDERNFAIVKAVGEVYRKLADKLFENNPVMNALIMTNVSTMNIYSFPVCGKCETVALPNMPIVDPITGATTSTCGCMRCGTITRNPPTVKEWMRDELRRRVQPEFFELIDVGIERIAVSMMRTWLNDLTVGLEQDNGYHEDGVEVDHERIQ